jgi:hypothetical protein
MGTGRRTGAKRSETGSEKGGREQEATVPGRGRERPQGPTGMADREEARPGGQSLMPRWERRGLLNEALIDGD